MPASLSAGTLYRIDIERKYKKGQQRITETLMISRSHHQRAPEEPSLRAGESQRIVVPSIVIGEFRR